MMTNICTKTFIARLFLTGKEQEHSIQDRGSSGIVLKYRYVCIYNGIYHIH